MSERVDKAGAYVRRVVGGARFEDGQLDDLLSSMTAAEIDEAVRRLGDYGELYIAIALAAGADDPRLALLAALMWDDERARCREAIGELWLRAQPFGRPN